MPWGVLNSINVQESTVQWAIVDKNGIIVKKGNLLLATLQNIIPLLLDLMT
ncbi:MAG TPA: hypothetical protein VFV86_02205 [Nitrososphaeraceae archaeon]|nr:hypothetical protein [Nitrososphaeraceae archaeon]